MEESKPLNNSSDHNNNIHLPLTNGDGESVCKLSAEEVKAALEITASTGKFWLDWEELKSMLYFQLKQVLSEYPEATMGDDQQNSALGEKYLQLVTRLEEALFSFIEGPPFTLQRLSEILLNARTIYPKLSKLALALEKNLLVTSTLTKCTDPYPSSVAQSAKDTEPQPVSKPEPKPEVLEREREPENELLQLEQADPHSSAVANGEEMMGDKDEVMTEVENEVDGSVIIMDPMEAFDKIINSPDKVDADVDGCVTVDAMETFQKIINSPDTNPDPPSVS